MLGVGKHRWSVGCTDIGHISLRQLVSGNLLDLLSYKWQQNERFWKSTFPFFWGQTCRNQTHTWVCVWKICMAFKPSWDCFSKGNLTSPARCLHRCGRFVGGDVYPLGVWCFSMSVFLCVYLLYADFTLLPWALRSSSSAGVSACKPQGNQPGTCPNIFRCLSMG